MELENSILRDTLLTRGLDIDGLHVEFFRHQKRVEPRWKVFVSKLPSGITKDEIYSAVRDYGDIKEIQVFYVLYVIYFKFFMVKNLLWVTGLSYLQL